MHDIFAVLFFCFQHTGFKSNHDNAGNRADFKLFDEGHKKKTNPKLTAF